MVREGKFSYRTCFQTVRIPFPYLLNLARSSNYKDAIATWFLVETLNAIGAHSML